jgi:co-chaperonin GroES (HSP10)
MNPRPLQNRVLVKQDPPKDKIGSLYTPQGSEVYPEFGTVLAIGPKVVEDIRVGDRVLFKRQADTALNPDAREGDAQGWKGLLMLREDAIIGIVTEES